MFTMELHKQYRLKWDKNNPYTCVGFTLDGTPIVQRPGGTVNAISDSSAWEGVPPEQWVVLMWADAKHKNTVIVNSEMFTSEQSAINKWVEHPNYIGTKQVS